MQEQNIVIWITSNICKTLIFIYEFVQTQPERQKIRRKMEFTKSSESISYLEKELVISIISCLFG